MKLIINAETRNKCGGGSSEYWFSYNDYTIKNIAQLDIGEKPEDMSQSAYFVSIGVIPFVAVSNEEIMHALLRAKGSAKLNAALDKIDENNFIETFWKYYNAYPELKENTNEFADEYINKKIISWCEENNVEYVIED